MKKRFGIVSCNLYCNFMNYGSILQSWALSQAVERLGNGKWQAVLVDYCPNVLLDRNPLSPVEYMWDADPESRRQCELSLPAIRENYYRLMDFCTGHFDKTKKYTAETFSKIEVDEQFDGFLCGSDTIFCIDEFGFDDGYYAEYPVMKDGYAVSYAASFGDAQFDENTYEILNSRLGNFKAIGLRERKYLDYVQSHTAVPAHMTVDPTLLLGAEDYEEITSGRLIHEKYLLLYSRRYNPQMERFAEEFAAENGWEIVEISLRASNASKHRMFYEAGIEEFLSLIKYAEFVVTNSYHGMIFSVQFTRPFYIFSRAQCDTKISELLGLFSLTDRLCVSGQKVPIVPVDYHTVHTRIQLAREGSLRFLKKALEKCGT
ncbi:polysaccharide pyruvyl transferase family protein [bacterium 1XD42-94]|nr:polysaccharide pyruvyl transferase family protein [bacterium 1XD42-76]NBK05506.1 polysaccharide pyruvyl transferase family protein [bacterium 1XD42-94]